MDANRRFTLSIDGKVLCSIGYNDFWIASISAPFFPGTSDPISGTFCIVVQDSIAKMLPVIDVAKAIHPEMLFETTLQVTNNKMIFRHCYTITTTKIEGDEPGHKPCMVDIGFKECSSDEETLRQYLKVKWYDWFPLKSAVNNNK